MHRRIEDEAMPAHTAVMRAVRVTGDAGDGLCMLRGISERGAILSMPQLFKPGEGVTIEVRSGRDITGVVRWIERPDLAGVQFAEPVDVAWLLNKDPAFNDRTRPPRFNRNAPAHFYSDGRRIAAVLRNISIMGARIELREPGYQHHESRIDLSIDGLGIQAGVVRWQDEKSIGVMFAQPLAIAALGAWLCNASFAQQPCREVS
jgi:hypothetical protein